MPVIGSQVPASSDLQIASILGGLPAFGRKGRRGRGGARKRQRGEAVERADADDAADEALLLVRSACLCCGHLYVLSPVHCIDASII
jgi:hypothetical protein